MRSWLLLQAVALALVSGSIISTELRAQEPPPKVTSQRVTLDFDTSPLDEVTRFYSNLMKFNFIIAGDLKGKRITVLAPQPVTPDEAYDAFLVALQMKGMTVVDMGGYVRIVPASEGPSTAPIKGPRGSLRVPTGMEMRIMPLDYASPQELAQVVKRLATKDARLISDARTNSLIVVEHGDNLPRLVAIIRTLDSPSIQDRIYVVPVENRDAAYLQKTLGSVRGKLDETPARGQSGRRRTAE